MKLIRWNKISKSVLVIGNESDREALVQRLLSVENSKDKIKFVASEDSASILGCLNDVDKVYVGSNVTNDFKKQSNFILYRSE